ncbi:adenine nucleotide transporter [Kwoniella heveanensis CBS 569]|nr:adenine nucleotide transporter [Kwoniella heveanensis CBS 569]
MSPAPHPPLTPFGSALAGALGSVFANAVVYPLDTVKTRLQAEEYPGDEDDDDDDDEEESEEEGDARGESGGKEDDVEARAQVSGLTPLETSTLKSSSRGGKSISSSKAESKGKSKSKSKAGAIEQYLIAKLKLKRWGMLMMLVRIISREGLGGMFHGFGASMLGTFSQQFAYFFFHTLLRSTYIKRLSATPSSSKTQLPAVNARPISLSTSSELLLGALAGALAQIFTIPVQVIATRQQLWKTPSSHQHHHQHGDHGHHAVQHSPSLMETAHEIISEKGITGLWTGLKPGLVLTVNPAITYGAFERLKSLRLAQRGAGATGKLGVGEAFWLGVGSKTLATIVTYPYIFAKVRLQAKPIIDKSDDDVAVESELTRDPTGTAILGSGAAGVTEKQDHQSKSTDTAGLSSSEESQSTGVTSNAPSYASVASAPPSFGSAVVSTSASGSPDDPAHQGSRPAMQKRKSSSHHLQHQHHHYDDALTLLKAVYKEHGWRGWYQGLGAQITKAVLCQVLVE